MNVEDSLFETLKLMLDFPDTEDDNIKDVIAYHIQRAIKKGE